MKRVSAKSETRPSSDFFRSSGPYTGNRETTRRPPKLTAHRVLPHELNPQRKSIQVKSRLIGTGISVVLLLSLVACTRSTQGSDPASESVEAMLDELRLTNAQAWGVTVPGMGAALLKTGDKEPTRATSGSADPPGTSPLELDDRFHVGSITKTFTAALIMLLDQEGLLRLDDPISKWIDYPSGDTVTVRMLLGHTSGIADFTDSPAFTHTETPIDAIALSKPMDPLFAAGSGWSYSNTNYTILGVIAEKVTGITWAELVVTRFFRPLNLESTYIWNGQSLPNTAQGSRMACGESNEPPCRPQTGLELLAVNQGADWSVAWAAGAIVSTPRDICEWMMHLVSGNVVDTEHRDLMTKPSPESIAALRNLPSFGSLRWVGDGLGLFQYEIEDEGIGWGHEGLINGFVANTAYMHDSQRSFAITSNFAMTDSFSALGDFVQRANN